MNKYFETFLKKRGYTDSFLEKLNYNYDNKLKDLDKFVSLLHNSKNIIILTDTDMDGITSGVILYTCLKAFGFNVGIYDLSVSSYGFNKTDIDNILKSKPDTIITADVGITLIDEIDYAKSKGIKVLLTDHHIQQKVSNADVTINPNRLDEEYPLKGICGAAVSYLCMEAYALKYYPELLSDLRYMKAFAGLGTISDVMPLVNNNRDFVNTLIDVMRNKPILENEVFNTPLQGFYTLLGYLKYQDKWKISEDLDVDFVGFYITPMFNAIRRMEKSTDIAYRLFLSSKNQNFVCKELYDLNEQRKKEVDEYMRGLDYEAQIYAPYIYFTDARPTLLGLMANKLMTKTGLPTFVVNKDSLSGSGRTPFYFPAQEILRPLGFNIEGHENAFGIKFESRKQLGDLFRFLDEHLHEYNTVDDKPFDIYDVADIIITDENYDYPALLEFFFMLDNLRPFGQGFEYPQIAFKINDNFNIKSLSNGKHFKVDLGDFNILCFNQEYQEGFVLGRLGLNTFNGITSLQMIGDLIC